jgi:branched-chain amino acid transport system permease protein
VNEPRAALPSVLDDRFRGSEIAFWSLPIVAMFVFPEHLVLGAQVLIAGLFTLSLDLVLGYAGVVSLGHAAFFGAGAYTAGLLAVHGWGEPLTGLLAAAAVAAALGFCSSFLIVRGHGLTRLMVTLGVGLSLHEAANQASSVTGGTDGLAGMSIGSLFGLWSFDLLGRVAYVYALVVCFGCLLIVRRIVHSPFGLALRGMRENERRMRALGAPVHRRLCEVYTLAAALAGVAGALAAQTTEYVGLEVLSFERSASALVMLVLGGAGRLYGAFVGSLAFMVLQSLFADFEPAYWQFWMGLTVALIALTARGGLLGQLSSALARPSRAVSGGSAR